MSEIPLPDGDLLDAIAVWRNWLAGRDAGLVPIADPARFQWPGWWIAIVRTSDADEGRAALAFGIPPGIVFSPQDHALMGRAVADLTVTAGYAVASLDPVIGTRRAASALDGRVEAVAIAPTAEADMQLLEVAQARAGRGLEGDRYAAGAGTFSPGEEHRSGYDLTLIAAEVLDELATAGHHVDFTATRRNVLTRGIDVNDLVGRTFLIGEVICEGRRLCEPCAHLEELSGPGLLRPLIHQGGLRVDILTDGEIRPGAPICLA